SSVHHMPAKDYPLACQTQTRKSRICYLSYLSSGPVIPVNQPFKYFSESGDISPLLLFLQQEKHS
ncbi:hypothetical protein, partial [Escherichia coli]|uniref:hypothetical protein n=1 Tax=Escherichia coli TaxID=562 RepID=UPI001BCA16F7